MIFFYWELNKVLTSFINLAYWVLSQTSNMPENMSWFSLICLHLQWFGWGFPQKQFSKTGFFPPACSGLIPGWKPTSLLISLPWPCSFYWVICRPHTWKAEDRMRSQNLLPFQGTCTLLWLCLLHQAAQAPAPVLLPARSLAEDLSHAVDCTINSTTGPWYWLELPAATIKCISTAIIQTNKKCYMRFPVQGRLSVLHSVSSSSAVTNST